MRNIKVGSVPIEQVIKTKNKILRINNFVKKNRKGLIISGVFCSLISVYMVLIINFINLIKIIY